MACSVGADRVEAKGFEHLNDDACLVMSGIAVAVA
jgi:hypothetical protein